MEKTFSLAYGTQEIPLTIRGGEIDVLDVLPPSPIEDVPAAFLEAVTGDGLGAPPLKELISPEDKVTVIISDITRAWMHQEKICPLVLDYLHDEIGVPDENIVYLVAQGTHRAMTEAELRRVASYEVYDRVKVVNHDCDGDVVSLGKTSRGTEVEVNPLVVGRKVILLSGTVHHFFAGYGGGRKSILPGVCSRRTIMQNHAHALSPTEGKSNPLCGLGVTEGNPVHEDMVEAARMANPVYGISLAVDGQGRHVALLAGHWHRAWQESCRVVDSMSGVPLPEKADVVVVSAGGDPKDINLYQGCKAMINGYQALKPGGRLIFLCQCPEGGGPEEFFGWSKYLADRSLESALRQNFTVAGYIFFVCVEIAAACRVENHSALPRETVEEMGMMVLDHPGVMDFGDSRVIVMPHGGATVPLTKFF